MQEITISNYFVRAVLAKAASVGFNVHALMQRAGIPPRFYNEPDSRVTAEQFALLQALTMRQMNNEMLGYGARPLGIGAWSALCHWLIASNSLRQALTRFSHFYQLLGKGFDVQFAVRANEAKVIFNNWEMADPIEPYGYELFMFSFHRLACWLIDRRLPVTTVTLPYGKPAHSHEYRALFPRSECVFEQVEAAVIIDRKSLDYPIRQTSESLRQFLRRPSLNLIVNDYNHSSWTAKTKRILAERLTVLPTLVEVARELDVHPKTLRRYLEMEGIGYAELKSQLRRDMAIRYLTNSNDRVEYIAQKVGFSEACTFSRAFKSWTGASPEIYRKKLRGA